MNKNLKNAYLMSNKVFREVYDSPTALPGRFKWRTSKSDVRLPLLKVAAVSPGREDQQIKRTPDQVTKQKISAFDIALHTYTPANKEQQPC